MKKLRFIIIKLVRVRIKFVLNYLFVTIIYTLKKNIFVVVVFRMRKAAKAILENKEEDLKAVLPKIQDINGVLFTLFFFFLKQKI